VAGGYHDRSGALSPKEQVWRRSTFSEQRRVWHASCSGPNVKRVLFTPEHLGVERPGDALVA
jgi:hypothetical protein